MKKHKSSHLVSWGKAELEKTSEFRYKVAGIRKAVQEKHAQAMSSETNFIKKLWLRFLIGLEIKKEIRKVSSHKNLHIGFDLYHA